MCCFLIFFFLPVGFETFSGRLVSGKERGLKMTTTCVCVCVCECVYDWRENEKLEERNKSGKKNLKKRNGKLETSKTSKKMSSR